MLECVVYAFLYLAAVLLISPLSQPQQVVVMIMWIYITSSDPLPYS